MNWLSAWVRSITQQDKIDNLLEKVAQDQNAMDNLNSQIASLTIKLVKANELIYQLQKTDDGKAKKITELQEQVDQMHSTIDNNLSTIESLKAALATYGETQAPVPEGIDTTKSAYLPYRQILDMRADQSGFDVSGFTITNQRNMFVIFPAQREKILANGWNSLPSKHKKLMALWLWMSDLNVRRYKSDWGDNWQFSIETAYRKLGDCEDSSVFFVSYARALGISSDEIFLVCGDTEFGYHAYPIVKYTREDAQEAFNNPEKAGWYIYESTANWTPTSPTALNGSVYHVDSLMNWQHVGGVKSGHEQEFNSKTSGYPTGQRVINNEDKLQKIRKYWVEDLKLAKESEG